MMYNGYKLAVKALVLRELRLFLLQKIRNQHIINLKFSVNAVELILSNLKCADFCLIFV